MRSLIVGTAGHIDHGKSALVRALTGTDPDRLPEEKRRGITIDLGFADLALDDLRLGFVDVPGHERFVKNMLAGAHGIDVLALVVAADESVMPQTREHFDICRLLGVTDGLIVITKRDLVDDEMILLVEDEVKELVANSFLADAPVVSVSAKTGRGLDEFKTALQSVAKRVSPRSDQLVTRLPVDRAFSMKGFGAVITGTLISGEIREGDELELLPPSLPVRVRGVQVHSRQVNHAEAGQRTAVNLGGVDVAQIERGMVLAPVGYLHPTQIIDAHLTVLPTASRPVRSRARVRVHIGAAEVLARVRVLDESNEISSGKSGLAQLRLDSSIVALHHDRFIVRSYSPAETIAGGVVLNSFATKHRGKQLVAVREQLQRLTGIDPVATLITLVEIAGEHGLRLKELRAHTGWTKKVQHELVSKAQLDHLVRDAGGVLLSPGTFDRLSQEVVVELERHHKKEPLSRGMLRETLRERLFSHVPTEIFTAVLGELEIKGSVISEKETVRLRDHRLDISEQDAKLRDTLEGIYLNARMSPPSMDEAMTRAGLATAQRAHARKIVQLLIDNQKLVRITNEMLMHAEAVSELKARLLDFADKHEPERLIDVSEFKDLAGVSRKYAIPFLEYFDRERVTRRAGDKRLVLK
ncbi:MAG: selenocysteine-specific translation elongation factor [Blastocatellia bacterium]|nr:MAG: selenocysteine-specific translation elongation factor [Blastocatellia bacterium]